jgi:hypothetical protein
MEEEPSPARSELLGAPNPASRRRRHWFYLAALPLCAGLLTWSLNYVLVQRGVSQALNSDERNAGYSISAHYHYYLDPSTLVLDLRDVSAAAPLDLFRGLFQSAAALASSGRGFDRVILARAGTPVFKMTGDDFRKLGVEFGDGQNPVYLIRTLPEKLYKPTGEAAFGHWEGGMLGVLRKQMEDATEAGRLWASAQ